MSLEKGRKIEASSEVEFTEEELELIMGEDYKAPEEREEEPEEAPEEDAQEEEVAEEPQEEASPEETWIDDGAKRLAADYGISEEDLQQLGGKDELGRLTRLLDAQLAKAAAGRDDETVPLDKEPAPEKQEAAKEAKEGFTGDGKFDLEFFREKGFDEDLIKVLEHENELKDETSQVKQQIQELQTAFFETQKRYVQEKQKQVVDAFHDALDAYDPEFYGKSIDDSGKEVDVGSEADERRRKVFEAAISIEPELKRQGRSTSWSALVRTAHHIVFGDEHRKQKDKERLDRVKEQSSKRRPVGRTASVKPAKQKFDDPFSVEALANDDEIAAKYEELMRASGAR